ncbi:hypothetical protein DL771_009341 [Monosporascus sp. 5C6A]|nr:hypothetical protein DL771_009341 [Monosporascus sp. 5C6A]
MQRCSFRGFRSEHPVPLDALCTIQNEIGHKDWEEQSAQMANIYGNSVVTITEANSSGVTEGFLRTAAPFTEPFISEAPAYISDAFRSASRKTRMSPPLTVYARRVLDGTWCFQEEFLSPRVLGFCGDEMPYSANGLWQFLIHDYGRQKLTAITDRLPALSGVARVVQGLFEYSILLGG